MAAAVERQLCERGCDSRLYDARSLPHWLCREEDDIPEEYGKLKQLLGAMDAIVLAVPIYLFAPSGAAKNLLDIVGEVMVKKPVGFVYASGSVRSYLAIRDVMSSLIFEFGSYVFPQTIHVDEQTELKEMNVRIADFCDEFRKFSSCLSPMSAMKQPRSEAV